MIIRLSFLLLAATVAVSALLASKPGRAREITILHTNDAHGRYLPFKVAPGNATAQTGDPGREPQSFDRSGKVGGMASLASAVGAIRAARGPGNVLLVNGGDTFGDDLLGNLTRGEAMISLMNAVGFQFMALGNHDFDYGVERTRQLQSIASFPMRGANVVDRQGKPFLGDPTKVFRIGGVRVGVLGLGYHNTDETGSRENVRGLRFTDGLEAARRHVPGLRRRADIVVIVSHQGSAVDRELAKKVPGIDLIIGAHSHDQISPPEKVGSTWMAQAMSDNAALGELTLTLDSKRRLKDVRGQVHTLWNDIFRPDPKVEQLVERLRKPHRLQLEQVLATATDRIGRRYRSESPFDVLVGDILRKHTGADVAFLPGVGYGVSLEPGPITREALYTLLPHPSKVVTMELSGDQILSVLEQTATNQNPATPSDRVGGLLQTSGLRWTVDLTHPSGRRIRNVSVGGQPLESARFYKIVTHSGMKEGLHRYRTLSMGRNSVTTEEQVTEVVERALRAEERVRSPRLGSVTLIKSD